MTEQSTSVNSSLEGRPVAFFVQSASKYESSITIKVDDKIVNAKSIMGMISLGISNGQTITLIAEGKDEVQAIDELCKLLK